MDTTNFYTSKRRVIRISPKGAPYTQDAAGKKAYKPIAKFVKTANGSMRDITLNNALPNRVTRGVVKGVRKTRSNAGMKRGPGSRFQARLNDILQGKFNNKPAPTRKPRARRINPRSGNNFDATEVMARMMRPRKIRSNAGVKRGPRGENMPMLGSLFN